MLEQLRDIQGLLLKSMPDNETPEREALELLDILIDELKGER